MMRRLFLLFLFWNLVSLFPKNRGDKSVSMMREWTSMGSWSKSWETNGTA